RVRRDVLEHLERVQGTARLALRCAQVRLEAPAIAAVGVAVGLQGGQHRFCTTPADEQLEPSPIQQARMAGHERRGELEIDTHVGSLAPGPYIFAAPISRRGARYVLQPDADPACP